MITLFSVYGIFYSIIPGFFQCRLYLSRPFQLLKSTVIILTFVLSQIYIAYYILCAILGFGHKKLNKLIQFLYS